MTGPVTTSSPASLLCPTCGAAAAPGDRFCEGCGTDLPYTDSAGVNEPEDIDKDAAFASEVIDGAPVVSVPCASCGAAGTDVADGYCGVCGMKQPAASDHIEMTFDRVAAVTDRGRKHHRNEDAVALDVTAERVAAVVCDGVSSTVSPDEASQAAAGAALGVLLAVNEADVSDTLLKAHAAAQDAVAAVDAKLQPDLGPPSCTFLAAVIEAGNIDVATLGDCRAYWLPQEGTPEVLTEDDSWAAEQVAAGVLTSEEAYDNPLAHTITRWLGRDADPLWRPRLVRFPILGPGRIVLCSDGLWNYAATGAEVAGATRAADSAAPTGAADPLTVAQQLVRFANDKGGHDNITVIVIDVQPAQSQTDRKDVPDGKSD